MFDTIITAIREVYSAKTYERRNNRVENLVDLLNENNLNKFLSFLNDNGYLIEKIDRWSSLPKLSQYSEHSINYLERMFGKLTNKKKARAMRLPLLLDNLDELIEDIIIRHEDVGVVEDKKKKSNEKFKKGKDIYEDSLFKEVDYLFFKVKAITRSLGWYDVDLKNMYCSCESFNYGGYVCKHMFGMFIYMRVENGEEWSELSKEVDSFKFLKQSRIKFVEYPLLKAIIKIHDFPVTIGENTLKEFLKDRKISSN